MASELSVTVAVTFAKANFSTITRSKAGALVDVAGTKAHMSVQSVGFSAEEALGKGELGTLGYGLFHNMDATNYVVIRPATGVTTGVKLKAGEWALFRLSASSPFVIADTASVDLEYMLFED